MFQLSEKFLLHECESKMWSGKDFCIILGLVFLFFFFPDKAVSFYKVQLYEDIENWNLLYSKIWAILWLNSILLP